MKKFALTFALLSLAPFANAGTDVGHGGDAVECVASAANPLKGLYQVDYVMTLGPDDKPTVSDVPARKWEESVERIRRLLLQKYPELGRAFSDFLADINNFSDYQRPRIWTPTAHGLIQIDDQKFVRALPENCVGKSKDSASVFQAVVRIEKPRIIEYEADYKILKSLEFFPIQYSFMLVHEWLWDYTGDVQAIRWANRLLHSENLERLSPENLRESLRNIGISAGTPRFRPVCSRTDNIARKIEAILGKPCEKITESDLDEYQGPDYHLHKYMIDLSSSGVATLKPGDFSGLRYLGFLMMNRNQITDLPEGVFADLNGLEQLEITDNRIRSLPGAFLAGLPSIKMVLLSKNEIEEIGPGFHSKVSGSFQLDLSDNRIRILPPDFLHFGGGVSFHIDLRRNRIESISDSILDFSSSGLSRLFLGGNPVCSSSDIQRFVARARTLNVQVICDN